MYLIIGLGNPEEEYSNTRHNMGFDTINKVSEKYNIKINKTKYNALYGTGIIENEKVVLIKPQTFMNLSGESVIQFIKFYKVKMDNVIIIYDDIDIEPGIIKIRKKGGPGTHNGMKSIINELQNDNFYRIRIGIGKPENKVDLIKYVIGKIPSSERKKLDEGISRATESITEILINGIDSSMNKFN